MKYDYIFGKHMVLVYNADRLKLEEFDAFVRCSAHRTDDATVEVSGFSGIESNFFLKNSKRSR